jgi:phospholipid transport system transporter-binding protein
MSIVSLVNAGEGRFVVEGDLTFYAMDKKALSTFGFLATAKQITIDLGRVGNADSAGLALMLEWIKHARSKRVQLRFINIPGQILNLAKLSNLELPGHFVSS